MSTPLPDVTPEKPALEFWRSTPPALFPSMMGLFGLGLAWRAVAQFAPISISPWISYVILGLACLIELFILSSYISKTSYRPGVVLDDLKSVPGRAGVSAITISVFLFAATLAPFAPSVASVALLVALPVHALTTVTTLVVMARTPGGMIVSPAWHLSFVGVIVACLAAVPLGYIGLARFIFWIAIVLAIAIYAVSLLQMYKSDMPAPLRPMLAIHLAPVSLFATVAALLGSGGLSLIFATLAIGIAGVLASRLRYLTGAGFSPLWGAFTFPIAAFSVALFVVSVQIPTFGWLALVPLIFVSILTPFVVSRVLLMWLTGALATKTGAAIA